MSRRKTPSSSSSAEVTELTLSRLTESMNQYSASALASLTVPEFKGSPGEDVREFLSNFKTATIYLNDDLRCLAIQKGLMGSAKIWAKANLKNELDSGNWRGVQDKLIKRFEGSDAEIVNLEKLSKLTFEPNQDTLISYLEKYASRYRKAHPSSTDADIVRALKINLPKNVQRGLNILNTGWTELTTMNDLYDLAKLVEEKILAYEATDAEDTQIKASELAKALKEVKDLLMNKEQKKPEAAISNEAASANLAAARVYQRPATRPSNGQSQDFHSVETQQNFEPTHRQIGFNGPKYYRGQNSNQPHLGRAGQQRMYRPFYQNRNQPMPYQARGYSQYRYEQPNNRQEWRPTRPMLANREGHRAIETNSGHSQALVPSNNRDHRAPVNSVVEEYFRKYGQPSRPCKVCQGNHYDRHCPYSNLN